jgi:hypothetical protein
MGLIKKSRFGRLLGSVKRGFKRLTSKFAYDFWAEIENNEIAKSRRPERAAVRWYRDEYMNNPDRHVKRRIAAPGTLIMFDYDNPKYKDELKFYDTQPLVLVVQPFITKEEKIRIQGINLHLLPPKIRQLVLYQAFYLYKSEYTAQLFTDKKALQVNVEWAAIKKQLEKYGAGFAFRMYIPQRQKNVIEFRQEDWAKAIYIPSKGYAKIGPAKLEKEWREFVKTQGKKINTAGQGHTSAV